MEFCHYGKVGTLCLELIGLSYIYERPILGDNPKPHKILLKSIVLFSAFH